MKKINKIVASLAVFAMLAVAVFASYPAGNKAKAAGIVDDGISHGNVSRLGELLVLDGLFDNNGITTGRTGGIGGASRLGELLVLDGLFSNSSGIADGTRNVSRLGELLVLDGLFGRDSRTGNVGTRNISRLSELLVLDGLFGSNHGFIR